MFTLAQIMVCVRHIAFQVQNDQAATPTPSPVTRKDTPPHLPSTPGQTALTFGESPTAKVITPRLALTNRAHEAASQAVRSPHTPTQTHRLAGKGNSLGTKRQVLHGLSEAVRQKDASHTDCPL